MSTSTSPDPTDFTDEDFSGDDNANPRAFNLNYLFLIIGFALLIAVVFSLLITRRKRQNKAELRRQGATALARDVANFPDPLRSRWDYGAWRSGFRSTGIHAAEEGLDERGEAPPPYILDDKPPSINDMGPINNGRNENASSGSTSQPDIPLRNMSGRRPPEYHEVHARTSTQSPYPSEVITAPGTALTFPSEVMSDVDEEMYRTATSRMRLSSPRSGHGRRSLRSTLGSDSGSPV